MTYNKTFGHRFRSTGHGTNHVNVAANRTARKWTRRENFGRILWTLVQPLFSLSPRPLWGWRRMLLRLFGATIGQGVHVFPTVRITIPWNLKLSDNCAVGDRAILYALGPITVGARATISQGAHLCAGSHDWRKSDMPLTKPEITVGEDCWIAADAFVGPDVTIGPATILGARAVAMRNLPADVIAVGNPAQIVSTRSVHVPT